MKTACGMCPERASLWRRTREIYPVGYALQVLPHRLVLVMQWGCALDETSREHGVDFALAEAFDMEMAVQVPGLRYDESRPYGCVGGRMHVTFHAWPSQRHPVACPQGCPQGTTTDGAQNGVYDE